MLQCGQHTLGKPHHDIGNRLYHSDISPSYHHTAMHNASIV